MNSQEIRTQFLEFFRSKNHEILPSSPLFLEGDPSLLFVNAGMNQFKKYFLGQSKSPFQRIANSQKCLRVSGKHNDLDEVGFDNYHHTLFEMLGSWSFSNYYKKEAIVWAWELMTQVFKIPKKQLYATVFESDTESFDIWSTQTDIDKDRILRFGEKDNFWEMGATGPCGPASEIHIDLGAGSCALEGQKDHHCGVNQDCERFLELWNIVFISYNRLEDGSLKDLDERFIDTGMGLERITRVLQKTNSNYETDLFLPYIQFLEKRSGFEYHKVDFQLRGAMCVIADHIRALVFAIADGIKPSNTSRGYILRRILRRAIRYGKKLNLEGLFLAPLSRIVIECMGGAFPALKEQAAIIESTIEQEEEKFTKTLNKGLQLFEKEIAGIGNGERLSGKSAFILYDTYGFPFDLTLLLCKEKGINVDEKEFDVYMNEQKELAKKNQQFQSQQKEISMIVVKETQQETEFLGYVQTQAKDLNVLQYRLLEEENGIELILDKTPFYAESGGQVADNGVFESETCVIEVNDVQKENGIFTHYGTIKQGSFNPNNPLKGIVNEERRNALKRHHTSTHLLHKAVQTLFGEDAEFTSTYVNENYFICEIPSNKLSIQEIKELEKLMNQLIQECHPVVTTIENLEDVKARGVIGRFESKYKDVVRVVTIEGIGSDLCGGTHVSNTGEIGIYKLLSDTSAGIGVRRLESIAGIKAWEYLHDFHEGYRALSLEMRVPILDISSKIEGLLKENKQLKKELKESEKKGVDTLSLNDVTVVDKKNNTAFLLGIFKDATVPSLKKLAESLSAKEESYIAVLLTEGDNKNYLLTISINLLERGVDISKLNSLIIKHLAAKGGGRGLSSLGGYGLEMDDRIKEEMKNDLFQVLDFELNK